MVICVWYLVFFKIKEITDFKFSKNKMNIQKEKSQCPQGKVWLISTHHGVHDECCLDCSEGCNILNNANSIVDPEGGPDQVMLR